MTDATLPPYSTMKNADQLKSQCMNLYDQLVTLTHIAQNEASRADRYKAKLDEYCAQPVAVDVESLKTELYDKFTVYRSEHSRGYRVATIAIDEIIDHLASTGRLNPIPEDTVTANLCDDCGSEMILVCSGLEKLTRQDNAGKCVVGTKDEPIGRDHQWVPQDTIDMVVEALDDLTELQGSALSLKKRSELIRAPEDKAVKDLCELHGYGAVMDSAARQWYLIDSDGSHTTYHCYSVVEQVTEKVKQALAALNQWRRK